MNISYEKYRGAGWDHPESVRLAGIFASSGWTDGRVLILKKLWAEGLSTRQIAYQLGGVTRNAVIGKINRLGLSASPTYRKKTPQKPSTPNKLPAHTKRVDGGKMELVDDGGGSVLFEHLKTHHCRWITGDPKGQHHYCGDRNSRPYGYCQHHHERSVSTRRLTSDATKQKQRRAGMVLRHRLIGVE